MANSSGKISKLYIVKGQKVKEGEYLAAIENKANADDILQLKNVLDSFDYNNTGQLVLPANIRIGEMEYQYRLFTDALQSYYELKNSSYLKNKQYLLKQQIDAQEELRHKLRNADAKTENYQKNGTSVSIDSSVIKIQINQLQNELLDIQNTHSQQLLSLKNNAENLKRELIIQVESWQNKYALTAPADGQVFFINGEYTSGQEIEKGDILFTISPNSESKVVEKVYVPISLCPDIKPGQKVEIILATYPREKYGAIGGVVESISSIPVRKGDAECCSVMVCLQDGMKTTTGFEVPYFEDMRVEVKFTIAEKTAVQKIFGL